MSANNQPLFDNVPKGDPLDFWANHGLDYDRLTEFLDLNKAAWSKLAGVSKSSVRFGGQGKFGVRGN